jgi:MFS family permease
MVSLLVAGNLVALLGSRTILLLAAGMYALVLILLGAVVQKWQLVLLLFLFGFVGNLFNISVNTQAVAVEKKYGKPIMASFHGIWSLAGFCGAAFGTLMLGLGWAPAYHFAASAALVWLLMLLFSKGTVYAPSKKGQPFFAMPDKGLLHLGLIVFFCLVCEGTFFDWSGVYFSEVVHSPTALTSLGYAAFMGCMACGRFIADKMVSRFGSKKMLVGSGVVIFCGILLSVLIPVLWVATLGFMLAGFGVSSVVPIVYSRAGKHNTMHPGQALAAVSSVGFAGFLAGPPLIGFISEASSLQWSFGLVALFGLTAGLLAKTLPE